MKGVRWSVVFIVACLFIFSVQMLPVLALNEMSITNALDKQTSSKEMTSIQGVEYKVTFSPQDTMLYLNAINPKRNEIDKTGFVVAVDDHHFYAEKNMTFQRGEEKYWEVNITEGLNAVKSDHTVTISTFGDSSRFNFTEKINASNSGSIPTPYIAGVEIRNGTIDGEPSAVAKVTVANPSIHPYPLKLMVHTIETDGSFYGAAVPPGENRTITVELLDERGSQIAGEARLYAGNLSQGDGAMDQIGFAGRAGEDTKTWNETYEPIEGPWRSDSYEYRNETYEDDTSLAERISGGYEIFGIPVVYFVPGLVAGLVLFRRIR